MPTVSWPPLAMSVLAAAPLDKVQGGAAALGNVHSEAASLVNAYVSPVVRQRSGELASRERRSHHVAQLRTPS